MRTWGLIINTNTWSIQDVAGVPIACGTGGGVWPQDHMISNARLMCAAPKLFVALDNLLDAVERMNGPQMERPTDADLTRVCVAAANALRVAKEGA